MSELNIDNLITPKKVLEFGNIKIHLQGVDAPQEHYIDVIKLRTYKDLAEADRAGAEHFRRLISCMVKKVEGVKLRGQPWDVTFTDGSKREITLESYVIIDKVLSKLAEQKATQLVLDFYAQQKKDLSDGIELDVDTEEDAKKKD